MKLRLVADWWGMPPCHCHPSLPISLSYLRAPCERHVQAICEGIWRAPTRLLPARHAVALLAEITSWIRDSVEGQDGFDRGETAI